MARQVFEYQDPDRFVAGTVGQPGARTFFLQVRSGARLTSVVAEKRQVSVLAERMNELLDEVAKSGHLTLEDVAELALPLADVTAPEAVPADTAPLDTPIEEEFRIGTMSLSWDPEDERVVLECYAAEDDDSLPDDAVPDGAVLRVKFTGAHARAFVTRALAVVAAGRPPCPFCDGPLDPEGHICPRSNGYRR